MLKKSDSKQALPVTLLDELRSEEIKKRINAVTQLKTIAHALGPDRTRLELIPFLNEFIDDEEEVLKILIGNLKDFATFIGGEANEKCMLPLLISLCKSDEKVPSEMAAEAILTILKRMDPKKNEELVLEVLKKLIDSESLRGKQAGINLLTVLIRDLNQNALIEIFYSFSCDQNFQIRKIAAKNLKNLVGNVKDNPPTLTKIVGGLLNDREDLIKLLALDGAIVYFPENPLLVLESLKSMLTVNSWRINMKICQGLPILIKMLTKTQFKVFIEPVYFKFLTHDEPELRASACGCLELVCANLEQADITRVVIPIVQKLATDPKPFVRVEISKVFLSLCQFLPKQAINDQLMPILAGFLKDSDPNTYLSVFSSLSNLSTSVAAPQLEETTLQCIGQLFSSTDWRTKCKAIEVMHELIKFPNFMNDRMISLTIGWVFDKIDAVRQKALTLIEMLFKSGDTEMIENKLIPKLISIQNCPSYLQRQLILHIIERTSKSVSSEVLNGNFLTVMVNLSKDKVPNIRFLVLRVIRNNPTLLANMRYKNIVEGLLDDRDNEVKAEARTLLG